MRATAPASTVMLNLADFHRLTLLAPGEFVRALLEVPAGQNLLGAAGSLSWNEYAALWGKVHGVNCRFERLDRKVIEEAIPGGIGKEFADMFEYIAEFGYDGGDPTVVLPKDVRASSPCHSVVMFIDMQHSLASMSRSSLLRSTSDRRTGHRCCSLIDAKAAKGGILLAGASKVIRLGVLHPNAKFILELLEFPVMKCFFKTRFSAAFRL